MPGNYSYHINTSALRPCHGLMCQLTVALVLLVGCGDGPASDGQKSQAAKLGTKLMVGSSAAVRSKDVVRPIPDFGSIPDVKAKKEAFFTYMVAKVRAANDEVWAERLFVQSQRQLLAAGEAIGEDELEALQELAEYYKIAWPELPDDGWFEVLLERVDTVPASLVLAQAANESGWGTSRFARQGRNFFGIWCYTENCGLAPKQREAGAKHQVRKYPTVLRGVHDYIRNINVGNAYADLRAARAALRAEDELPSGAALAGSLQRYSERGEEYVVELRAMIKQNKLSRFTLDRKETTSIR